MRSTRSSRSAVRSRMGTVFMSSILTSTSSRSRPTMTSFATHLESRSCGVSNQSLFACSCRYHRKRQARQPGGLPDPHRNPKQTLLARGIRCDQSLDDRRPIILPDAPKTCQNKRPISTTVHFAENEQHSHESVLGLYTGNPNRSTV